MLTRESERRIARLSRRARTIAFLDGAADATVVGGLAAGSALLLVRLLVGPAPAAVVWALLVAVVTGCQSEFSAPSISKPLSQTPEPDAASML